MILFYQWNSFCNRGIERALQKMGREYEVYFYQQTDWEEDPVFEAGLRQQIKKKAYECVFSVNFAPVVSKVCQEAGIRYVSWVYDSPMHIRNLEVMKNSCNDIYMFDRGQIERYRKKGVTMQYMPLAVDPEVFAPAIQEHLPQYQSQVALVGKTYETEYAFYSNPLGQYTRGYLEGIIDAQKSMPSGNIIPDLVRPSLIDRINKEYEEKKIDFIMEDRELEYLLACEETARRRGQALTLLSNHFEVKLYSGDKVTIPKVKQMGYVDYYSQMPQVFAESKINLNISLRAIETGIPLRVVDLLGCGGFIMTNPQTEILEYLQVGTHLETYESLEELYVKTKFYLSHEELRKKIAQNGLDAARMAFTFESRLEEML